MEVYNLGNFSQRIDARSTSGRVTTRARLEDRAVGVDLARSSSVAHILFFLERVDCLNIKAPSTSSKNSERPRLEILNECKHGQPVTERQVFSC
jgi:hypothetical protein